MDRILTGLNFEPIMHTWKSECHSHCIVFENNGSANYRRWSKTRLPDTKSLISVLLCLTVLLSLTRTSSAAPTNSAGSDIEERGSLNMAHVQDESSRMERSLSPSNDAIINAFKNPCNAKNQSSIMEALEMFTIEQRKSLLPDIFRRLSSGSSVLHVLIVNRTITRYQSCSSFPLELLMNISTLEQTRGMSKLEAYKQQYYQIVFHTAQINHMLIKQESNSEACQICRESGENITTYLRTIFNALKEIMCTMLYTTPALNLTVDYNMITEEAVRAANYNYNLDCSNRCILDCQVLKSLVAALESLSNFLNLQSI